jgi:hypothetical protein
MVARPAQPIHLGIYQCIQRFLHAAAHNVPQVALNPLAVDPDDLRQSLALGLRAILFHIGSFPLRWLISQYQSNQIRDH